MRRGRRPDIRPQQFTLRVDIARELQRFHASWDLRSRAPQAWLAVELVGTIDMVSIWALGPNPAGRVAALVECRALTPSSTSGQCADEDGADRLNVLERIVGNFFEAGHPQLQAPRSGVVSWSGVVNHRVGIFTDQRST